MTTPTGTAAESVDYAATYAVGMVGRDRELSTLAEAVNRAPSVAVIAGEAGIGKTRLVTELRADQRVEYRRFLVGACRQVRDPFPLGPVVEAIRQLAGPLADVRLSPLTGALRPLLPELSDMLPAAPEPIADRRAEQHRRFRTLAELLAATPTALVLEDLHWADAQTYDFLRYLLADPPAELSLVLTYRDEEAAPAIRALSARPPHAVHHTRVTLSPLDPQATGALATAILGTDGVSGEFASYLCERASGLPFAIEELLALLRTRGSVAYGRGDRARRELEELDVPVGIRDQVLERVGQFDKDTREVLATAAVLRVPTPVAVLHAGCGLRPDRLPVAVEAALTGGMLAESGDRLGFRHVLAAEAVYASLPEIRRRQLHSSAADTLRTLDRPPWSQIAEHLHHAGRTDEWIAAAEQAAAQAIAAGHTAEAVRVLTAVLQETTLEVTRASRMAVTLAKAALDADHGEDVPDLLERVLALPGMDHDTRGELCLFTAIIDDKGRVDVGRQRELCREAVDHLGPDRADLRAWAMACLGIPVGADEPVSELRSWLQRALSELGEVADPAARIRLQGKVAMVLALFGDGQWRELTEQIAAFPPGGTAQHREAAWAYYTIAVESCLAGHHDSAGGLLDRALGRTPQWDSPTRHAALRSARALIDYCQGDWAGLPERVDRLVDELVDFAPARSDVELIAGCLGLARGNLTRTRSLLGRVLDGADDAGLSHNGIVLDAWLRLELADGNIDDARSIVHRLLTGLEKQGMWAQLSRSLPAVIETLVRAGELDTGRGVLERADQELRQLDAPLAAATLRRSHGVLAAARGSWRPAADAYLAAAEQYHRRLCPYEAAQSLEQAAACQLQAGDPAGQDSWRAALADYQRLEAAWDVNRTALLGRRFGLTPPLRHRGGRRGYGDQLSPREREVAQLMAAGRNNLEIAAELFLSRSTVEKHTIAVRRKLDARSREQVAERMSTSTPDS